MKKFKLGFTLAEVLITLGIIGVVAAIVMPTVMTAHQYSIIGVRLAKFHQQAENAARSFAVMSTNNLTDDNFDDFYDQTFIFRAGNELKDGTVLTGDADTQPAVGQGWQTLLHGAVVGQFVFSPRPEGLPVAIRNRTYTFGVTELGYVFPATADACLVAIVNNEYKVSRSFYEDNCEAQG